MARAPAGTRKLQILQNLAEMLQDPKSDKITTATLAERTGVSEAALYRHFASKAQMFEGLIDFIETSLFSLINQVQIKEESGLAQAHHISLIIINFAHKNPGMCKVLTGDALVHEDARLQIRINHIFDKLELALKEALKTAAMQQQFAIEEINSKASILLHYVLGRCQRYSKTQFKFPIMSEVDDQLKRIILG